MAAQLAPGAVYKSAVQTAIEAGANIDRVRELLIASRERLDWETLTAAINTGNLKVVELCFSHALASPHSDGDKEIRVAGHWVQAALDRSPELARYLLDFGKRYESNDSAPGLRALVRFIRKGDEERALKLMDLGVECDVDACRFEPLDPLVVALEGGQRKIAKRILEKREKGEYVRSNERAVVLRRALQKHYEDIVEILLASPEYGSVTQEGGEPLLRAFKLQDGFQTVDQLLQAVKGDVRDNLLLFGTRFAAATGANAFTRFLLDRIQNPSCLHRPKIMGTYESPRSSLEIALKKRYPGVAKMILEKWTCSAENIEEGCNALRLALHQKYFDIAAELLGKGACETGGEFDNEIRETAIQLVLQEAGDDFELTRKVLAATKPKNTTKEMMLFDAMLACSSRGLGAAVRFIINEALSHDAPNYAKFVEDAIRYAVQNKHVDVAAFLLEKALKGKPEREGPILVAAVNAKSEECLEALVQHGFNVDVMETQTDMHLSLPSRSLHLFAYAIERGTLRQAELVARTKPRLLLTHTHSEVLAELYTRPSAGAVAFESLSPAQSAAVHELFFTADFAEDWKLRASAAAVIYILGIDGAKVKNSAADWDQAHYERALARFASHTDKLVPHIIRPVRAKRGESIEMNLEGLLYEPHERPAAILQSASATPGSGTKRKMPPSASFAVAQKSARGMTEKLAPPNALKDRKTSEFQLEAVSELLACPSWVGLNVTTRDKFLAFLAELEPLVLAETTAQF
eukprot:tig00001206_g7509.t1